MKLWMHKVEKVVDYLIPPAVIVLFAVIIIELFMADFAAKYSLWITIADYCVLFVFLLDVIFKYIRIKPFKRFLRESWIDILVVFPFGLIFRAFEGIFNIFIAGEIVEGGQKIVHETLEIEKEASVIVKEAESTGKIARTTRFARFIRPFTRAPRILKAFSFHERPTGHHYPHEKEHKKHIKIKGKNLKKNKIRKKK